MSTSKESKLQRLRSKLGMLKSQASSESVYRSQAEPEETVAKAPAISPPVLEVTPSVEVKTTGQRLSEVNWGRKPLAKPSPSPAMATWTVGKRLGSVNWGREATVRTPDHSSDKPADQSAPQTMSVDGFFADANW